LLLSALLSFAGCGDNSGENAHSRVDKYSEESLAAYTVESGNNAKFTYDVYLQDGKPEFVWVTGPVSEEETHYEFPSHLDGVPITGIAANAFSYAPIMKLTFPGELEYIGQGAFYNCPALTAVSIPPSVEKVEDYAFYSCVMLESVSIPDSLAMIGGLAFQDTPWLEKQIDEFVIVGDHVLIHANVTGEVTVPRDVRYISSAFYRNEQITAVTLPQGLMEIGPASFMGCTALTNIQLPDSIVRIGASAFRMCSSLTALTLPESVAEIGVYAFDGLGGEVTAPAGSRAAKLLADRDGE